MTTARLVRDRLTATAAALGPDAPTLCDPWTVRDLLAHLVVRESRPDVLPGIGAGKGPLARHTEAVQDRAAEAGQQELLSRVESGPPAWWPTRVPALDDLVNTAEFVVHHEDMVRAQPGWEPTDFGPEVDAAMWRTLRTGARMMYRSAPVGVVLVAEGTVTGRTAARGPRSGGGSVVVRGTPLELLLHAFGRTGVAQVQIEGSDADVAALEDDTRSV